ncbi:aspartate aminotransferase family protein [Bacteroidetes bacterium endosymbiont of Geopemphigus sp.]|uniref:aspartate aminotransferase family protein n=1 Tax=Bacteroidetes bacterium endosymbiont of Geopemphigus sp. TaxID=2047937 RepID=UPI000CD1EA6A|nr:aminotransferase class III-fold pyridoxal phosphate-dependent enzyme [Bacteroidetes bacterium endosymbiont of Geopemphigus sp.]
MNLLDVYPTLPIELIRGRGALIFDKDEKEYLDFYGGHAVISIGHSHPHYVKALNEQIEHIGFYSNAIKIPKQQELAEELGKISGYEAYNLFLCNSGAEAVENALKIASFHNKKKKVIAFKGAFHGRTSGAVAITDSPRIITPFNDAHERVLLEHHDFDKIEKELKKGDVCAVIVEGIQGVAGIVDPGIEFFRFLKECCRKYDTILILDEIQSGYGRSGDFFAHQLAGIRPDLITVAKGMGNGFPMGGVLITPDLKAFHGMLGTTFGGNYLACVAGLAVLQVIKKEHLIENSKKIGQILIKGLREIPQIKAISGRGLMLGLRFEFAISSLKNILLSRERIFVGTATDPHILRLLPPLNLSRVQAEDFIKKLKKALVYFEHE